MKPIAITRVAVHSALGSTLEETVRALAACEVGIRTPSDLEQRPKIDAGAGEVPLAESEKGVWRAEVLMRRTLASLLTRDDWSAIARAPGRWCAVIGTTLAGMRHCGVGMRADEAGDLERADASFARITASSVLAHSLGEAGFVGPSLSVSCACASALSAVNHACSLLEAGEADGVIAGGYDPIAEFAYGGFSALQLVASGPLSPFASDREGMKLGEGAALFVLRRLEDVAADELESVRAVITGADESSDAHHLTQPHPEGDGAARVLRGVGCDTKPLDLLVAHATGTPGNDSAEYAAYRRALGARLPKVPVVALKSRFGHPLGAAGALELAASIGCAEAGFTPSSAGRGRDADAFPELDLIEGATRPQAPVEIVALSAGFGGANAATRIRRRPVDALAAAPAPAPDVPRAPCALAVRGFGAVSPAGRGVAALVARADQPEPWPDFDESVLHALMDRTRARRLGLLPRLMIGAVRDLVESAGIDAELLRDTPLIAANWCGAADFTERYYRDLVRSGIDLANPMLFAESVPNIGSAQCSLAFGMRAATMSVIGRRTAALEALLLARARIAAGQWERAIVVAAEEAHPIVNRILERCAGKPVAQRSAAIALLVERAPTPAPAGVLAIGPIAGRTGPAHGARPRTPWPTMVRVSGASSELSGRPAFCLTSSSPLDDAIDRPDGDLRRVFGAEFGAATPLAALLSDGGAAGARRGAAGARRGARVLAAADPHGAHWTAEIPSTD